MPQFLHVARILPGKRDEFREVIRTGFQTAREAMKAFGFTRVTSFISEETTDDGGGLLVTIYEANDPSVVERFYQNPAVIEGERRNHGTLVTPHGHDSLPTNTPFLDMRLD